jgi:hypothetical protein
MSTALLTGRSRFAAVERALPRLLGGYPLPDRLGQFPRAHVFGSSRCRPPGDFHNLPELLFSHIPKYVTPNLGQFPVMASCHIYSYLSADDLIGQ